MGKTVAKLTGADAGAEGARKAAEQTAAATREAANRSAQQAREAASQAARSQEAAAARNAAEGAAADALATPVEDADVNVSGPAASNNTANRRKQRAQFGLGSSGTGVNI